MVCELQIATESVLDSYLLEMRAKVRRFWVKDLVWIALNHSFNFRAENAWNLFSDVTFKNWTFLYKLSVQIPMIY